MEKSFASELEKFLAGEKVDEEERVSLAARLRLIRAFNTMDGRRLCVIARLLSVSVVGMLWDFTVSTRMNFTLITVLALICSNYGLRLWCANHQFLPSRVVIKMYDVHPKLFLGFINIFGFGFY